MGSRAASPVFDLAFEQVSFHPERDNDRVGQVDGRAAVQRHPVAGHAHAGHRGGHPRPFAEGR